MDERLRALLFPRARCLACDEPREIDAGADLCDGCLAELDALRLTGGLCSHCLSPLRAGQACAYCAGGGMLGLDAAYAPYRYHGASQRLIAGLKFRRLRRAALPLAEAMADSLHGAGFDLTVPVPLHADDLRDRGFNQSALLCGHLQRLLGLPTEGALIKAKRTHQQSSLSHEEREDNVSNAYVAVRPLYGKKVLLVDDVRTTGSTARACARELRRAGAVSVCLLTAAVAARYSSAPQSSSSSLPPA